LTGEGDAFRVLAAACGRGGHSDSTGKGRAALWGIKNHRYVGVYWRFASVVVHPTIPFNGGSMTDRQDRLLELCRQLTSEDDPQELLKHATEINNILGSILSDVDRAMRSLDARAEHLMRQSAVIAVN
jgi:hypothetical protein